MISKNTSQIERDINQTKQSIRLTRERKEKVQNVIQSMRNRLIEVRDNRSIEISHEFE
jgi:septal ring factor EnvC (AmiA/AmiB activator)